MVYVSLISSGDVIISLVEPRADDETILRVLPVENFTDAVAVQGMVWQAFNLGSSLSMRETDALKSEIDEYKAVNKKLVERIDGLIGFQEVSQNYARACTYLLRRIMSQLAISTIVQITHRERNEQIRAMVREIKYTIEKPIDQWLTPPRDMEDIPF